MRNRMDELKAREICLATDHSAYTHDECAEADQWVKTFTLDKFDQYLRKWKIPPALKEFTMLCVRAHFGSVETDRLMQKCKCYPEWLKTK